MRKNIKLMILTAMISTAMLIGGCGTLKVKPLDNVEMSLDKVFRKEFPKETEKIKDEIQEKYDVEAENPKEPVHAESGIS